MTFTMEQIIEIKRRRLQFRDRDLFPEIVALCDMILSMEQEIISLQSEIVSLHEDAAGESL